MKTLFFFLMMGFVLIGCSSKYPDEQPNQWAYNQNPPQYPQDDGYHPPVCKVEKSYNTDGTLKKDATVCDYGTKKETLNYNLYEYDSNKTLIKKKMYTTAGVDEMTTPLYICYVLYSGSRMNYYFPDGSSADENACASF